MNHVVKTIVFCLVILICIAGLVLCFYWHHNIHWYDAYETALIDVNAKEKQVILPNGNVINYGEVENDKPALLLIHGQMGQWEDYALVLPELSRNWHIYSVDVYGHGKSSHDENLYYLDVNGNDLIWFVDNVIKEPAVVSGHSNGAITAAYMAAYGGSSIADVILEDPPIFSTEGEGWENTFAYLDTYKPLHAYNASDQTECWEAYYLRHCLWGQLFMPNAMPKIADYAEKYHQRHPQEAVKIGFLPSSMWYIFEFAKEYDFAYGERFYDVSWNHGYTHKEILEAIDVPCIYIHATEYQHEGIYLCAATKEQAQRAVSYIGDNCTIVESGSSDHVIHTVHSQLYVDTVNSMLK